MDNTSNGGDEATQGTGDQTSRFDAAAARATAETGAWRIRPPRDAADYRAGEWLGGRSYPGGDIPCRWVPPEYLEMAAAPDGYVEPGDAAWPEHGAHHQGEAGS
jgi:hypothetical protein